MDRFLFFLLALVMPLVVMSEIVSLTTSTFNTYLDQNPETIVMFYAPWCSHSKRFFPYFEEASTHLSHIKFASVNCIENPDLYWSQKIDHYPTIKYYDPIFLNHGPISYDGELEFEELIKFINKQSGTGFFELEPSLSNIAQFRRDHLSPTTPILLIGEVGRHQAEDDKYLSTISYICKSKAFTCAHTTSSDLLWEFGIPVSEEEEKRPLTIHLLRDFEGEEALVQLPLSTLENGEELVWIRNHMFPKLVHLREGTQPLMFSQDRPGFRTHVLFVLDSSQSSISRTLQSLREVASSPNLVGKCAFGWVDVTLKDQDDLTREVLQNLQVDIGDIPTAMIVHSQEKVLQFHSLPPTVEETLSQQEVTSWVQSVIDGSSIPTRVIQTED